MRRPSWPKRLLLVAAASWAAACADELADDGDALQEARAQFALAYGAVRAGLLPAGFDPSEELRQYPLYPYLQAAIIERDLSAADGAWTAADERAEAFLSAHDAEPVSRDVRRAWLRSLAAREAWEDFRIQYRPDVADATLRCQQLQARIALAEEDGLEALVVEQWLTAHRLPPECEPAFQWLRDRDALDEELVERRVRLLLGNGEAGFARIVARRLPQPRAATLLKWADLIEQPQTSLDRLLAGEAAADVEHEVLAEAWMRLARNRPTAALERYARLAAGPGAAQASVFARSLALGLSWDRRPEALEYFGLVTPEDLDDYALSWKARAAFWAGDWTGAARAIAAMSHEQREQPRWRYWAARSAEQLGDGERARELYASLLPHDNYYAAMAAARLGRPVQPNPRTLPLDEDRLLALAASPAFVRARELLLARLHSHAVSEWLFGFAPLADEDRTQAIQLAARWGWHDVSVASATRQRVFNDYVLLYPRPFDEHVDAAAKLADVPVELLYGIIRQESLFRADAVSPAGALGAAQLMPETARRTAQRWNLPAPRRADLFDPGINIKLAAAHLRDLHERFGDQTVVALAGYNAGANAAARWLPERPLDADIWIENIPFNETRDYVQRVLWHSIVFAWLGGGDAPRADAWIAQILPMPPEALAAGE